MAIVGIGVDIEEIARFDRVEPDRLLTRVFTECERSYCFSKRQPGRHFAARFAAKEATVTAVSRTLPGLRITQVELYKEPGSSAPLVRLINGATLPEHLILHVSVSHAKEYATAFVVAEIVG